ncbi:Auxin Efflux Carrier [Desulfofarcimen acetoxidans DSM 771]|uniref:Auxin Efflux Carrier n=1 Tax=Desulfofarcimen acetoxidans (strain ATCC 49208 / DSM 771 / KCTC 5769 / VKM B-1644 / 5575) TaxID=485916 RepID=C8VWV9_DESAS|nr:AEC family transporter [Desulfofarcimen acetoxidans]ACV62535.1 Auxin Efflux Carrier [Desulfofarcimen acetoxidans DSM 771]
MSGRIAVVINQIIIFAILMFVGYAGAKTDVITKDGLNALSKMIVKIILPALIFSIVADSGLTAKEFLISGKFSIGVICSYAALILSGMVLIKLCKLEGKSANVFLALMIFGNMGFMGIPLIQSIFKEPVAQVCISVYTIIDMALLWTLGVYLCSRHYDNLNSLSAVKNMVNPTTVALLIAFTIMFFKIPIPDLLMRTISGMGGTSKYLTLIYLGGTLAFIAVDKIIKKPSIFVLALVKMLFIPVSMYFLLGFFLPQTPRMILTLIVGLPSMTTVAMVATAYQSDDEYATEIIFKDRLILF